MKSPWMIPLATYQLLEADGFDMREYRAYPAGGRWARWWLRARCPHAAPLLAVGPGVKVCRRCNKRFVAPGPR